MREPASIVVGWIRLGVAAGIATCIVYPALIFLPLPLAPAALLVSAWGPLLAVASLGLSKILQVQRRSIAAQLGAIFNITAGALVVAMLLVQLAVRSVAEGAIATEIVAVWLGLDVAWDVYIGLGTALFALAMKGHPRFGLAFAAPGLAIAAALLVLNLYTFPQPPAEAGLFDIGPLVGLWYLVVSIQTWRSLGWVREISAED